MLPNGNTKVTFSVRVVANRTPLGFNYHWERSDGAQSRMEMMTVQPGTTEFNISTTWELGPAAAVGEIWEKLFINTGNTHLESQPVRFVFR